MYKTRNTLAQADNDTTISITHENKGGNAMKTLTITNDGMIGNISVGKPFVETESSKPIFIQFPVEVMSEGLRKSIVRKAESQAERMMESSNSVGDNMHLIPLFEAVTVSVWYDDRPTIRFDGMYVDPASTWIEYAVHELIALSDADTHWLLSQSAQALLRSVGLIEDEKEE